MGNALLASQLTAMVASARPLMPHSVVASHKVEVEQERRCQKGKIHKYL
jgi:hypothetical protein